MQFHLMSAMTAHLPDTAPGASRVKTPVSVALNLYNAAGSRDLASRALIISFGRQRVQPDEKSLVPAGVTHYHVSLLTQLCLMPAVVTHNASSILHKALYQHGGEQPKFTM